MDWIGALMGQGGKSVLEGIGTLAKDIRVAITGETPLDANQKLEIELKLAAMQSAAEQAAMNYDTVQMQGQVEINKIEAGSDNLFKSGWRPAVGWICVAGLALVFLLRPLLPWAVEVGGIIIGKKAVIPEIPDIPMEDMLVLLTGMLGLGTMRSVERIKTQRMRS